MKLRNRLSIVFTTLFFIFAGRISVAEDLNGMWAGYYTHYGQKHHMLMFIHHPGMQADDKVSGMIIDARPATGTLNAISASLKSVSFKDAMFSFTKTYSTEASALGYSDKIDYRLKMISQSEMAGKWHTGKFSGEVFFKRINPETIVPTLPEAAEKPEEIISSPKDQVVKAVSNKDQDREIAPSTETESQANVKKPEEVISLPEEQVVEVIRDEDENDRIAPSTTEALSLTP